MSLHKLSRELQKKGREGDSMLVHMNPREVAGLQAIARAQGGSLTINPDTGLVEAKFLKQILPVLAGAALNYFAPGIGTAIGSSLGLGGAAGTGLLVGGLETLRTGDVARGVTAGLGAYGGAGLAGAGAGAGAGGAGAGGAGAVTPEWTASSTGLNVVPGEAGTVAAAAPTTTPGWAQTSTGLNVLPGEAGTQAATGAGGMGKYALAAAAPVVAGAMEPAPIPDTSKQKREYGEGELLSPNFQAYVPRRPNPYYTPTGLGYAEGGIMDIAMARGGMFDDEAGRDEYARGGILGGYAEGQLLKGPGDGVSDSIPAVINGKQPARLADGEFVVPARVVSELGNGSTDAGARKLYAMMDRVQKARHKTVGKGKVAVNSKADKHLPA